MIKNILIVGCGSIGQRHAENAKKIGIENILLLDINISRIEPFARKIGTNLLYSSFEEIFDEKCEIDAAIISTPSALHVEHAKLLAEKGINIFIEKPLSNSLDGINELIDVINEKNIVSMMGHSYRFHEGLVELKKLLDTNIIGKIYHVNYYGGQYLPDWHPKMDYRREYSAKKELGGGVLLTTMSHMFDNIQWFFGDIIKITGWKSRLSDLEIDVEDSVFVLIKTNQGAIINTLFDFLQKCQQHKMIITGEKGHIEADFINHRIMVCKKSEELNYNYEFDNNKRYIDELKHFVELINDRTTEHELDVKHGMQIMEYILNPNIASITQI